MIEETDTATFRRLAPALAWMPKVLRQHLTPTALWAVLVGIISVTGTVTLYHNRFQQLEDGAAKEKQRLDADEKAIDETNHRLETIQDHLRDAERQIDQEEQWRWHVEQGAEVKPYPYKRTR